MSTRRARRAEVLDVKAYDYGKRDKADLPWATWATLQRVETSEEKAAREGVIADLKYRVTKRGEC